MAESEIPTRDSAEIPGRSLWWVGSVVTVFYLCFFAWFVREHWAQVTALKPNEIGDTLAGWFAPLAFLWLVLGFFQQGIELRQNSEALRLQVKELHAAATHASDMVDVARKEHQLALEAKERAERQRDAQERHSEIRRNQPRLWFFPDPIVYPGAKGRNTVRLENRWRRLHAPDACDAAERQHPHASTDIR
jgi:hypothetical protein